MESNSDNIQFKECSTIPPLVLILGIREDQISVPVFRKDCIYVTGNVNNLVIL